MSEETKNQNKYITWKQVYILWFALMIILSIWEYYTSKNSSDLFQYILTGTLLGICLPVFHHFVKRTYRFGKCSGCSALYIINGVLFDQDRKQIKNSKETFEEGARPILRAKGNCKNIKVMIEHKEFYLKTAINFYDENTKKINDIVITTGVIIAGILCMMFSGVISSNQIFFILVSLIFAILSLIVGCIANYRNISIPYNDTYLDLPQSKSEEKKILIEHYINIINLTEMHHFHTDIKIALKDGQLWLFFASLLIFILVVIWYTYSIIT